MSAPWLQSLARWGAGNDLATADCGPALANTALDFCGALIAGAAHPLYARYVSAFAACAGGGTSGHTVIGDARHWPLLEAAAANAAISHFWEFDDVHRTATMHPGITVYPVIFALAECLPDITVARMRGAVVAGYEIGTRVGTLLGKRHYAISHTTATAGCFAAAAAAAHMLGLTAEQTLWALGHAGTQAAGLWQFLDDDAVDAKPFHAASAVRNGITAAYLAQAGIAGAARMLEGKRGMLAAWALPAADGEALRFDPAAPLQITRATIKSWPVCGQMHSLLDAAEAMLARHFFAPAQLTRILVEVPTPLLDIADVKRPQTIGEMKFSTSFCLAILLTGGALPFSGLDESWLADERLHDLAARVEVVADPGFDARFPKERPARLTLWLADGARLTEERSYRRGDPEEPWTWAPLVRRFRDITSLAALDTPVQDDIIAWCEGFGRGDAIPANALALFNSRRPPDQRGRTNPTTSSGPS